MDAARLHTDPEVAEAQPASTSQRRARDDDSNVTTGKPRRKRRDTSASVTPSSCTTVDGEEPSITEMEDKASEDELCANPIKTILLVYLLVNVFDLTTLGSTQGTQVYM